MARRSKERRGRGRLSRLDMLPEEARPHLVWLNGELREGSRPQNELRDVFNAHLAGLGIEPISVGSFSRYTVRKATQFQEMDETLRMASELTETLGADSSDKMTIMLAQLINVTAVKLLEAEGGKMAAKDLMELGRMVQSVTGAQKQSADYRRTLEREFAIKVEAATAEVEQIGQAAGITAETMERIKNRLKGIV